MWQNIIFALGVKGIVLLLGAFGIATMWEAVFSDVGVTLLAVLNAMRVLRVKRFIKKRGRELICTLCKDILKKLGGIKKMISVFDRSHLL